MEAAQHEGAQKGSQQVNCLLTRPVIEDPGGQKGEEACPGLDQVIEELDHGCPFLFGAWL